MPSPAPFMKAIKKTAAIETNRGDERKSLFDEVINAARSYKGDDQLPAEWYRYIRQTSNQTLGQEYDGLIATNLE